MCNQGDKEDKVYRGEMGEEKSNEIKQPKVATGLGKKGGRTPGYT